MAKRIFPNIVHDAVKLSGPAKSEIFGTNTIFPLMYNMRKKYKIM